MKEPSKFEKAREQFKILSAPYKISESFKLYGDTDHLRKKRKCPEEYAEYVPRVQYCKFRPREEKEN